MELSQSISLLVFDFDGTLHSLSVDWEKARQAIHIAGSDESLGHAIDRLKKVDPEALKALDDLEHQALKAERLAKTVTTALQALMSRYHIAVLSRNASQPIRDILDRSGIH